jgi:hypothetical protein
MGTYTGQHEFVVGGSLVNRLKANLLYITRQQAIIKLIIFGTCLVAFPNFTSTRRTIPETTWSNDTQIDRLKSNEEKHFKNSEGNIPKSMVP